jgi:RNA polymerase sigma factor for flagellar operon FliA
MDAASRFAPAKQVSFGGYAKHRIRGAILDSLRQLDWASRDLRRRCRELESAVHQLMGELQRTPTEEEVADRLGIPVERSRHLMAEMHNLGMISADRRNGDHDDLPAPDYPGARQTQPDLMCARTEMRNVLDRAMGTLPQRYRQVMQLYYEADFTMKQIGEVLGVNESRVSQIHKAALEKMHNALHGAGISSASAFYGQ